MIYRFGDFELYEDGFCLTRDGLRISLEPKALSVLLVLVSRAGRLVEKRFLLETVWNSTFVEENTLTRTIGVLRRELGDSSKESRFIETIPTRGYRFIAPVETLPEHTTPQPAEPSATLPLSPPVVTPQSIGETSIPQPTLARTSRPILAATVVILLASGLAAWHLSSKPTPKEQPVSTPVPLTTYRGNENAPSFSPDGTQVAFEWNSEKQDKFEIYVKVIGTDSTPLRLTHDSHPSRWPSWSPDGSIIAFERIVGPGLVDLMLIPALGGPERKLAQLHSWTDVQGSNPTWSANSKWLVMPAVISSGPHLMRISTETGESYPITNPPTSLADACPIISPDGKTLLFNRHGSFNGGILYSVKIDADAQPTSTPTQLSDNRGFWQARWTADSAEIIAHTLDRFRGALRMSADGSYSSQRIPWLSNEGELDIARRGNRIAFSIVHGDTNIWRIDLTAKPLHPEPFIASTLRDVYPQYSPDGRKLAFHSDRSGIGLQIWVSDNEGNQARQLTFLKPGISGTPHWSPDGQTIAFDSSSTGHFQIYTISPDGGKIVQRTNGASDSFGATWSHDGRWLYFTTNQSGRNELWKVPIDGGNAIQVTHNEGAMGVESPDGATLYFSKETGTGSIWKMSTNGGPEQQLTDTLFRTNFAVTKSGIYFMTAPGVGDNSEIRFYSFATGATTTVVPIGLPEYGLAISPDGRYLIYDQLDDPASDLMLVENFH